MSRRVRPKRMGRGLNPDADALVLRVNMHRQRRTGARFINRQLSLPPPQRGLSQRYGYSARRRNDVTLEPGMRSNSDRESAPHAVRRSGAGSNAGEG